MCILLNECPAGPEDFGPKPSFWFRTGSDPSPVDAKPSRSSRCFCAQFSNSHAVEDFVHAKYVSNPVPPPSRLRGPHGGDSISVGDQPGFGEVELGFLLGLHLGVGQLYEDIGFYIHGRAGG